MEILLQMGLKNIFDIKEANFSKILEKSVTDEKLFVGEVLQKTFIEVNETGTVAAAATSNFFEHYSCLFTVLSYYRIRHGRRLRKRGPQAHYFSSGSPFHFLVNSYVRAYPKLSFLWTIILSWILDNKLFFCINKINIYIFLKTADSSKYFIWTYI